MAPQMAPSDFFPAVLRFLVDCGLTKTASKFQKETGVDADAAASLPKLEEVYSSWVKTKGTNGTPTNGKEVEVLSKQEKKKRKAAQLAAEEEAAAEAAVAEEAPKKKKRKKSMDIPVVEEEPVEEAAPEKKKKKKKDAAVEQDENGEVNGKVKGEAFRRINDDAWRAKIKDPRLLDNTHIAKAKFGGEDTGDSWADKASVDMLKVKGKDFRKEMMKKKKASWKGGGQLDQGVNSIPFSDSE